MYRPLTYFPDLGDVEIIEHEGKLHLFHLVLHNRDLVGHAVSEDGLSWTTLAPALRTGDPGSLDDDMIRTVSVTRHQDLFYMLYTATSRRFMENGISEGGRIERFGLATSKDLLSWEKRQDAPFVEADPRFYESTGDLGRLSFRDPKPYYENGKFYCVVDAREKDGPLLRRGCAALYESVDLIHWEPKAPLFAPRTFHDIECPQIMKIGNYYYLFGAIMEDQTQRYWVSEQLTGPYRTPYNHILMPSRSHYAARIGLFNGEPILCCWNQSVEDGPSPFGLFSNIGEVIRYVPSPLKIEQATDGSLTLAPFKTWNQYKLREAESVFWHDKNRLCGNQYAVVDAAGSRVEVISGMDGTISAGEYEDFILEGHVYMKGPRGGIGFHLQEDSTGYFIEFSPFEHKVRLIKHLAGSRNDRFIWFKYETRQENTFEMSRMDTIGASFMLRVVAGEIEFSLNGQVLLSTVSTSLTKGKVGLFVESGEIVGDSIRATKMNRPYTL